MKFTDNELRNAHHKVRLMLDEMQPISPGSKAEMYLRSRGIVFESGQRLPNDLGQDRNQDMIAVIRGPGGDVVSFQKTIISPDGHKRMMAKGISVPVGSAIRLYTPRNGVMGVAEGTETALSAAKLFQTAVWSTVSAQGMERWQPPVGIKHLSIFADADLNKIGQNAAEKLAKRVNSVGISVLIHDPPMGFDKSFDSKSRDWNDVKKYIEEPKNKKTMSRGMEM